jgi:hypothetical protein
MAGFRANKSLSSSSPPLYPKCGLFIAWLVLTQSRQQCRGLSVSIQARNRNRRAGPDSSIPSESALVAFDTTHSVIQYAVHSTQRYEYAWHIVRRSSRHHHHHHRHHKTHTRVSSFFRVAAKSDMSVLICDCFDATESLLLASSVATAHLSCSMRKIVSAALPLLCQFVLASGQCRAPISNTYHSTDRSRSAIVGSLLSAAAAHRDSAKPAHMPPSADSSRPTECL